MAGTASASLILLFTDKPFEFKMDDSIDKKMV